MDTRELRAFIAVAEELNFRRAAERLGMSQPPLTRLIAQLEADLGTKLFHRNTRQVELTGAGLHLLKRGQDLLNSFTGLEHEIRSLGQDRKRILRVAFDFGSLHSSLPRIISSFKEQFPHTTITTVDVKPTQVQRQLTSGKIDLYFGAARLDEALFARLRVQSQELGLLIANGNALAKQKEIRLKDLKGETLIYHGRHEKLGFQEEFLELLTNKGIRPQIYYKKNSESCGQLVSIDQGVMLATKRSIKAHPTTVFVPFVDYSPRLKLYATWLRAAPTLVLQSFLNFLQAQTRLPSSGLDGHLN